MGVGNGAPLREVSQTQKDTARFHFCVEPQQFFKGMAITKQKQTQRHREQMSGSQRGKWWGLTFYKSLKWRRVYRNIESLCCILESDIIKNTFPIKEKKHELLAVVSGKLQRVRARAGNRCRVFTPYSVYTPHIYVHCNTVLSKKEEAPRTDMK